jgi:CubicO group peptidase (beta-lactamase class C family)
MHRLLCPTCCVAVILAICAATAAQPPVHDIPKLDGIKIDGLPGDWGDKGFKVEVMVSTGGGVKAPKDFDPTFRLGWNDQGLLVLVKVMDDRPCESPSTLIYTHDSIEAFLAPDLSGSDVVQAIFAPGMDPAHPQLRQQLLDLRTTESLKAVKANPQAVATKIDGGYVMELLLPWDMVGVKPAVGREAAFQLIVNDHDGLNLFRAVWFPSGETNSRRDHMHCIRLAQNPSPPVTLAASGCYEPMRHISVGAAGLKDWTGKTVRVSMNGRDVGQLVLGEQEGRGVGQLTLPFPQPRKEPRQIDLAVDGSQLTSIPMTDLTATRRRWINGADLICHPFCFVGEEFPEVDFESPLEAENAIGTYTIKTAFYDDQYNLVTKAAKPGRYGAIVEATPVGGKTVCRRFLTVYRQDGFVPWWQRDMSAGLELPQELGVDESALQAGKQAVSRFLRNAAFAELDRSQSGAILLAGLRDMKGSTEPANAYNDPLALDRQWWLGLKARYYGTQNLIRGIKPPAQMEGPAVTVVHEGTLEEAGVVADAAKRMDEYCRTWAADSDEAFGVCVVRHGVVVLHKAYGRRDGKEMTVDTPSNLASLSKMLSGTLVMMAMDQGLIYLNDRADKYLPALKRIEADKPVTIRHLYTHTAGFFDHWPDEQSDLEERAVVSFPQVEVAKDFHYCGVDMALACKALEAVTGKTLPQLHKILLVDPLELRHSELTRSAYGTMSVPMDLAKVGQMLLNKGAYGKLRFMSPETWQQMLPAHLSWCLSPDRVKASKANDDCYGIGTQWLPEGALSKSAFGHGAASSTDLRIDPEYDLIVVMTRNSAGKNFEKYHGGFYKLIVECLKDRPTTTTAPASAG